MSKAIRPLFIVTRLSAGKVFSVVVAASQAQFNLLQISPVEIHESKYRYLFIGHETDEIEVKLYGKCLCFFFIFKWTISDLFLFIFVLFKTVFKTKNYRPAELKLRSSEKTTGPPPWPQALYFILSLVALSRTRIEPRYRLVILLQIIKRLSHSALY